MRYDTITSAAGPAAHVPHPPARLGRRDSNFRAQPRGWLSGIFLLSTRASTRVSHCTGVRRLCWILLRSGRAQTSASPLSTRCLSILNCSTVLVPGRFLAANNGGHNHHGAAVGQWIEGGRWENAGDDTVHVSGLVMSVGKLLNATSLVLRHSAPDVFASRYSDGDLKVGLGDVLQFFDRRRGLCSPK